MGINKPTERFSKFGFWVLHIILKVDFIISEWMYNGMKIEGYANKQEIINITQQQTRYEKN